MVGPVAVLGLAFLVHLGFFWDALRQLRRARREGESTSSPAYRAANTGIIVLLVLGAGVHVALGPRAPSLFPPGTAEIVGWLAVPPGLSGLALAVWAKLELGPWFSPTASYFPGQPVVTSGPYRWLRHPMYAGWWIFWASLSVASNSLILAMDAALILPLLAWLGRMERRFLQRKARVRPTFFAHSK